jgi:uncharacterized RDD family membrane protein YckC
MEGRASVSGVSSPATAPEPGPGTVAGFGQRVLAFLIDGLLADVIAIIVNGGYHRGARQSLSVAVAFLLIELVFVSVAGQTPGMRVVGIAVLRYDTRGRPAVRWVAVRTLLLATVLPALFTDGSGRAMHDRAAGTVTARTR